MPSNPIIHLELFDGARRPIAAAFKSLVTLNNGNHQQVFRDEVQGQPPQFKVEFFDNFGDDYSVLVAAKKHHDAGFFPIKVQLDTTHRLALMLLPKKSRYNFADWDTLKANDRTLTDFMTVGLSGEAEARARHDELLDGADPQMDALAAFHNLITALKAVQLRQGRPLDYFKQLFWEDPPPRRDRFFAFADARLIEQIKLAREDGGWATAPVFLHPGATSSFKQLQFGEANVQLSFHETVTKVINGVNCVKVEADMDYFKDLGAHFLLEVLPNTFTQTKTNPKLVYLLRWIAGQQAAAPFDPPYTIEAAT
ncbi:MAG: hypothetical protein HYR56_16050 [Acidobacteria bacterium]|nr:hypothetical protein [Acidobacteriota bacterium]MBI3423874.1 hypothetical protein [Acidobacteriota bacterium]